MKNEKKKEEEDKGKETKVSKDKHAVPRYSALGSEGGANLSV